MRLDGSDGDSKHFVSPDSDEPGPSSWANGSSAVSNGYTVTNGTSGRSPLITSNGASSSISSLKGQLASLHSPTVENGHTRAISRVKLSGTKLYPESFIDREEFVRLIAQTLRDVGYVYVGGTALVL